MKFFVMYRFHTISNQSNTKTVENVRKFLNFWQMFEKILEQWVYSQHLDRRKYYIWQQLIQHK